MMHSKKNEHKFQQSIQINLNYLHFTNFEDHMKTMIVMKMSMMKMSMKMMMKMKNKMKMMMMMIRGSQMAALVSFLDQLIHSHQASP